MVLSFILILLIAASGFSLTYLFAKDETFMWRAAAGNIVGSVIFGLVAFVLANVFGFSVVVVALALALSISPLLLLAKKDIKRRFTLDWRAAKSRTHGIGFKKAARVFYYVAFFLLFVIFFDKAMYQTGEGIFTGASQNLGDLPYHLGAIFSFSEGNNFPPQNPSYAGAKFSYPFMADLLTAALMKLGGDVKSAMLLQNVAWALSLLVILERFVFKFTESKLAGKIAPALLFFSGGLGFLWFFSEFGEQEKSFFAFLMNLPTDYTIRQQGLRWGNSLNVLFITQRSLLLGMPLAILVLQKLWEIFTEDAKPGQIETYKTKNKKTTAEDQKTSDEIQTPKTEDESPKTEDQTSSEVTPTKISSSPLLLFSSSAFIVGLLAGTLPLVHLHSLAALFGVTAFLFLFKPEKWREWIVFGVGTCIVAVPELLWSITDSASRTSEFIGWRFGWNKTPEENFTWFWIKNTGILLPVLAFGIYLLLTGQKTKPEDRNSKAKDRKPKTADRSENPAQTETELVSPQILFYFPFIFLFIVSNTIRMAPWDWDNIKVLIYWFVGSLPFVAFALAWIYARFNVAGKLIAAGLFFILIFAGGLDVWRISAGQVKIKVFSHEAIEIADDIRLRTPPNALFLNAPTYNSAVVLSGRRSFIRYVGHLSSHGIDYRERDEAQKKMYAGDATSEILLRQYGIEYVIVSPEERRDVPYVNEKYFEKFPLVAEVGNKEVGFSRVYKVK